MGKLLDADDFLTETRQPWLKWLCEVVVSGMWWPWHVGLSGGLFAVGGLLIWIGGAE